jgi:hypothetical protein
MDKSTLEADLKAVFYAMQDGSKTDAWMAAQVAQAIQTYILTGAVVTVDAGTAPAGAYAGAGTGAMTIAADDLEEDLAQTFEDTSTNSFLAAHMAGDIDTACSADGTVETASTGAVTTPAGAASPFAGAGKGAFAGTKVSIETLLLLCFEIMNTMPAGGDDYLASQLAAAADTYLKAGTISVTLQPPLEGSGEGALS